MIITDLEVLEVISQDTNTNIKGGASGIAFANAFAFGSVAAASTATATAAVNRVVVVSAS